MTSPPPADRVTAIRELLQAALDPSELVVVDDSAAHAGHAGAREGGHYRVLIRCARFAGLPQLARHRLVYAALEPLVGRGIHALSIEALLPS